MRWNFAYPSSRWLKAQAVKVLPAPVAAWISARASSAVARLPAVRALAESAEWLDFLRYVGSSALTPVTYIQTIFARVRPGAADPQLHLHADTFHSTVKSVVLSDRCPRGCGAIHLCAGFASFDPGTPRLGMAQEH